MKKIRLISIFLVIAMMLSFCLASCATPDAGDGTEDGSETYTDTNATDNNENDVPADEYNLPLEEGYNQLTIYFTHNASYDNCDIWMWWGDVAGRGYVLHKCAYGAKAVVNVPEGIEEVGFIVRKSCSDNLARGNKKAADEDMKLYNLTLNILYDLANVLGEKVLTFEEFSAALSLMFSESDIGTIPTSVDEVTIGSASMLRADKIKFAIIMGLNEGEFPASVKDNGIFTDSDKELLKDFDITLSADSSTKTSEELFFFYRAISVPSEKLMLTTSSLSSDGSNQRQSIAIERVKKLFPNVPQVKESSLSPLDKVWNIEIAK